MKKLVVQGLVLCAFLILCANPLRAQAVYGSMVGTVVDASGAVVTGAKITITDMGRDVSTTTVTNESGNYVQRALIVGLSIDFFGPFA